MYGMAHARVLWKQLYPLHKDIIKLLMPIPNNFMDYAHKCSTLRLLPLDKQLLFKKCVLMEKKRRLFTIKLHNSTMPERSHDSLWMSSHSWKWITFNQVKIDTSNSNLSFSGSLTLNSLPLHLDSVHLKHSQWKHSRHMLIHFDATDSGRLLEHKMQSV